MKQYLCDLCGNPLESNMKECQCGGPTPDGCILAQYGFRDWLRKCEEVHVTHTGGDSEKR